MNNEQQKEIAVKVVGFRVTLSEYELLQQQAKAEKRKLSDYIKLKLGLL